MEKCAKIALKNYRWHNLYTRLKFEARILFQMSMKRRLFRKLLKTILKNTLKPVIKVFQKI